MDILLILAYVVCWFYGVVIIFNGIGEAVNFMGDHPWKPTNLLAGALIVAVGVIIFAIPSLLKIN